MIGARSPALRVNAEGRILAGYLNETVALQVPAFVNAPLQFQQAIRERMGNANLVAENRTEPQSASFRHIEESDVIRLLSNIAPQIGGPATLDNLVGFEWIGIAGVLAGHYVAAPFPIPGKSPAKSANPVQIARYCLLGSDVEFQDLVLLRNGDVISPERLRLRPKNLNFSQQGVIVEYLAELEPSPITVLSIEGRVIGVRHLERLVSLYEAGVGEALCLVCYGYGAEMLKVLPTVDWALLRGMYPPKISDFTDKKLMLQIPVRTPGMVMRFSHQTFDLAP